MAHAPVTPVDPGHGCSRSRSPTTLHRAAVAAPSQDKDEPFSQRSFIQMPILEYMTFGRPRTLREAPRELTAGANQACNYTPDVRPCSFHEAKQTERQLCDQHVISALSLYQGDAEAGMTFTVPVEVSENRFRPGTRADELASECLNLGRVTFQQMRVLLELLPAQEVKRFQAPVQVAQASPTMAPGKGIQFGGWVFSGNAGVMNHTKQYPNVTQLLSCIVRSLRPDGNFSTLFLSFNVSTGLHRNSHNHAAVLNTIIP